MTDEKSGNGQMNPIVITALKQYRQNLGLIGFDRAYADLCQAVSADVLTTEEQEDFFQLCESIALAHNTIQTVL
ncbi:MAG: hypothetical protein M1338_05385 [Patescibacteria group bacterium]|nr:hypothetical protein [Patescibacteria group bacterium]